MRVSEYLNKNISGMYVMARDLQDNKFPIRFIRLEKEGFIEIESEKELLIGSTIKIEIPINGIVAAFVGQVTETTDKRYKLTLNQKAGLIQRRTKPRYACFVDISLENEKGVLIDISENGGQIITTLNPKINEEYKLAINNEIVQIKIVWSMNEEEVYRCGFFMSSPPESWKNLLKKFVRFNERV
ncbi:PilZ domain-containing protein [Thermosipho ferrireducens]|uniref:PilZ domain-containing protein n=1 Tax=Thermosipho ferrireducens TaxID=2571116 RepID=A0ABX7S7Q4_9BACT|nr:PilZ domain-containing protein [Thermosipho ferrireducens]QTA37840.1 PilZ domain-containing protein [Thermosipho ferrireducens]